MLVEFVKNSQNRRVGVIVAVYSERLGCPNIGWSRCDRQDKFDSEHAVDIAKGRAEKRLVEDDNTYTQLERVSVYNEETDEVLTHYEEFIHAIPASLVAAKDRDGRNVLTKMRDRMDHYFKQDAQILDVDIVTYTNKLKE